MIGELLTTDLYELLLRSNSEKTFFFESKDRKTTVLALGPTIDVSFLQASDFLLKNPNLLLWSAMSFENAELSVFHSSYLTLIKRDGRVSIIFNNHLRANLEDLFHNKPQAASTEVKGSAHHLPDFSEWKAMLESALDLLQTSDLLKIVLKRKKIINFQDKIKPLEIFQKIYEKDSETYNIFVQQNSKKAFLSFSPEKLFSLKDDKRMETISLAGSVPRGGSEIEDNKLQEELLSSEKLSYEQNIVTEEIQKRLSSIADSVEISPLSIMKLRYIQHRANTITAQLFSDKSFLDVLTVLHPTPAVGGTPSPLALATIASLEKEERNHYAAPIGFATKDFSEWAVGLRSALVDSNQLTVFAGCGIVPGSIPEMEWEETENKMRPFLNVLDKEQSHV